MSNSPLPYKKSIMKKTLLSIFVFAFVSGAIAQTEDAFHHHTAFGLKVGANGANIMSNQGDFDPIFGINAGLMAHLHLTKHFALQPELVYSGQGGMYNILGKDYKINLQYLNIPILFQLMFGSGLRIEAGPQIGFMLKAKVAQSSDDAITVDDSFKSTDVGLAFGISKLYSSGFGLDVRYNLGLTDISNSSADMKNGVVQAGIFYLFANQ